MKCYLCPRQYDSALKNNPREATLRLWCPTWLNAHEGPKPMCLVCLRNFQVEHNPNAINGHFFQDEEADAMFKTVQLFLPATDGRFLNARGMMENGGLIMGNIRSLRNESYFAPVVVVVDGQIWLGNSKLISHLGEYSEVKERFPKLFNKASTETG